MSSKRSTWSALFVVLVLTAIIRYGLVSVPLERDEGEYAYAGQLILEGVPPYQELYTVKLPGVYAAYALLLAVLGQTRQGIHAGLLLINAITTILVFSLAKQVMNRLGAVVSAASFALLSVGQSVEGVFANAEHFVIVFAVAGLLVLLQALASDKLWQLFVSGFLLGLSFVMKQHGLAFSALGAVYIASASVRQRPVLWHRLVLRLVTFVSGVIAVFGCLCLIMAQAGVFGNFWFWTVDYARDYVTQVPLLLAWPAFINGAAPIFSSAPWLWTLIGLGLVALVRIGIRKDYGVFIILYTVFSALSVCPGFYFRSHYFVLLLPCASLLAGIAASTLADLLSGLSSRRIGYGVAILLWVVCLGHAVYRQRDFLFHMTPFAVSRSTYSLNPFPESLEIADFIRRHTNSEDRIAILGSEPQIYFYAQRRSATGYIYMYPLMENHDFALRMQKDFINNVEAKKPKYVLFVNVPTSWLFRPDSHTEVLKWFGDYRQRALRLVGVVELSDNRTLYHWAPNVQGPVASRFWVAIFERAV
jgi:4-amino-4-deoxy-L-arabinose transferase-like glycosyltransferase